MDYRKAFQVESVEVEDQDTIKVTGRALEKLKIGDEIYINSNTQLNETVFETVFEIVDINYFGKSIGEIEPVFTGKIHLYGDISQVSENFKFLYSFVAT